LQIDLFPLSLDDACANLGGGFALLVLLIGVVELFQTGGASGAVCVLVTAMEAIVTHAVAIAIAGLLVE
jgi:hypothetical protein